MSDRRRFHVLKRDRFTCQYCGRSAPEVVLEVDHVIPISAGGPSTYDNLVTACRSCNQGKGRRPLELVTHWSEEESILARAVLAQLEERERLAILLSATEQASAERDGTE